MKRIVVLLMALMLMGSSLAEGALVTYFSHAGENYSVGVIEEGNTAKLAKVIAEQTGAELFEIVPVVDYPHSYDECLEVATAEQREGARPEYVGDVENWDQYDTIFIGYPIWWGDTPRIVSNFVEHVDLTGKTLAVFFTSGSSGLGNSMKHLEEQAGAGKWLEGKRFTGRTTAEEVVSWAKGLGIEP
jgi:flavodoxin